MSQASCGGVLAGRFCYHNEDCVDTALADCWCYSFHHGAIAKVNMKICRSRHFEVVEEVGHVGYPDLTILGRLGDCCGIRDSRTSLLH